MRNTILAALAVLSAAAMLPAEADAQSLNLGLPGIGGRRAPPPDDSMPPPPFMRQPAPRAATEAKPAGSETRGSGRTSQKDNCRAVKKRVTVDGREVTRNERVCG